MKLIKSSVEIIPQESGLIGALKQVEIAARNCYKSENKITNDSYKAMIDQLIAKGHYSPFEHGIVYLTVTDNNKKKLDSFYSKNRYSTVKYLNSLEGKKEKLEAVCITTNLRVIYENKREDDLKYLSDPSPIHEKAITVRFVCSRAIADEIMRHRMSICAESTRYCAYTRDKFNNEVTFVIPEFFAKDLAPGCQFYYDKHIDYWQRSEHANLSNYLQSLAWSEKNYLISVQNGVQPQVARGMLPLDVKSEVVMTGQLWQWNNFFNMRCSNAAHPDVRVLAENLKQQFIDNEIISSGVSTT